MELMAKRAVYQGLSSSDGSSPLDAAKRRTGGHTGAIREPSSIDAIITYEAVPADILAGLPHAQIDVMRVPAG